MNDRASINGKASPDKESCVAPFLGKYRGTVVNNVDPQMRGRLQVMVPDVLGLAIATWAMPCLPTGGVQGGVFTVPIIGAGVWIEFEQGDPDFPIWVGVFFGSTAEVPAMSKVVPPAVPAITSQTPTQTGTVITDMRGPTGGVLIKDASLATVSVNDVGVLIQNGKGASIELIGSMVIINKGALVIN